MTIPTSPELLKPQQKTKRFPYEERNEADFQELSNRIASTLEAIAHNENIPATEASVARLARCSRGTLRNRVWPLVRLKFVKEERTSKPKVSPPTRTPAEIERFDRQKLQNDLDACRTEGAKWFDALQNEKTVTRKLRRANTLLAEENAALRKTNASRKNQVSSSHAGATVTPFPRAK